MAGETVERIQLEAEEAITKAKTELAEYTGEVSRLERELEQAHIKAGEIQTSLDVAQSESIKLTSQAAGYVAQLGYFCTMSPLGWEHINLTSDYIWNEDKKMQQGKFRPLRPLNNP